MAIDQNCTFQKNWSFEILKKNCTEISVDTRHRFNVDTTSYDVVWHCINVETTSCVNQKVRFVELSHSTFPIYSNLPDMRRKLPGNLYTTWSPGEFWIFEATLLKVLSCESCEISQTAFLKSTSGRLFL